ncbi:MAG: SCO1664 family protein [Candidatus Planktophila sp.]
MKEDILVNGEIEVEGRLVDASNATLFVTITDNEETTQAIYKPIAGERPLWDFPDGNLASRERASYLISEALGSGCIPLTILRDGPFGIGAVQQWIDVNEDIDLEIYFREDRPELRTVALLDAVLNNTDRKIGHLLPSTQGKLFVCDHGVTLHTDNKLRTVLWQWAGQPLTVEEHSQLNSFLIFMDSPESSELRSLITVDEYSALRDRVVELITTMKFPEPNEDWPHIPWPPF